MEERSDRFTAVEDQYAGYTVYDQADEKIGKVDDLFLDENDNPEYIGVKMGFLGTRSTLIPFQMATVDEANSSITVSTDKETVQNGPTFDDDREITPEFENEVHGFYGLHQGLQETTGSPEARGAHAAHPPPDAAPHTPPELESEVHGFYGLHQGLQETTGSPEDRGAYADYSSSGSDL